MARSTGTHTAVQTRLSLSAGSVIQNIWVASSLLLLLAICVRLGDLDRLPLTDELYTSLAARGWLSEGAPHIADGIYDRAELYTLLVAGSFYLLGDSLAAARSLSVLAGSLLVVAVFFWTRSVASVGAAWTAALFMCLAPLSLQIAQFARFYALHALVFWLVAIGIYTLFSRRLSRSVTLLVGFGAAAGSLLALHLQILTLFGLVGIVLWLALMVGAPRLWAQRRSPGRLWGSIGVVTAVLVVVAVVLIASGLAQDLLREYRGVALWNAKHQNQFWFYHVFFVQRYATLWTLFPFLILLALSARPRPTIFCTLIFITAFVLLSFGGMKDNRYLYFALPFLFVVWAIALAKAFAWVWPWIVSTTDRQLRHLAPCLPMRLTRWTLITAALLFAVGANGAPPKTLLLLVGSRLVAEGGGAGLSSQETRADWAAIEAPLEPWLADASVVLTSSDVHHLYYLGDYDFALNASRISEVGGGEFVLDPRTGRPVVSAAESLKLIIDCHSDGLIIIDSFSWRYPAIVADAAADLIEARAMAIELPENARIKAFRWQRSARTSLPVECASLPDLAEASK